jgi:hypothetical protein
MSYPSVSVEPLESRRLLSGSDLLITLNQPVLSDPLLMPPVSAPASTPTAAGSGATTTPSSASSGTASPTPTPTPTTTPIATVTPTPVTRSTNLVGHWTGQVKAKLFLFITKKFSATLDISSQTATTLTGTISIDGNDFTGTFTGHINPKNGRFIYTVKDNDVSIKITGRLNRKETAMYGDISAKYMGFTVKGRHEFKKVS